MKDYIEKRSVALAEYIIEHKATVRAAAKSLEYQNQPDIKIFPNACTM